MDARFVDRYNAKIDKTGGPAACWNWTASLRCGYGQIGHEADMLQAHRVAWTIHRGPIPDGKCVLHRCDNRRCCNPDHLFLGTRTDNHADMVSKGRHRSRQALGIDHVNSKLNNDLVRDMRRMHAGGATQTVIAKHFGVRQSTVWSIVNGRTWKHVV